MAQIIEVSPDLLRQKATELRGYRSEHDGAISKIKSLVNGLPDQFKGRAASSYIERFNGMDSTFTNFSELLEDFAKKLDEVARVMEETDGTLASVLGK